MIANIKSIVLIDEGYIGCCILVDLQKAFNTVDHEILLSKLDYYGIKGISNNWLKSNLSIRKQFVSVNGCNSGLTEINFGVLQGCVIWPVLLLLYINNFNQAIRFCKLHHFTDDTYLLYLSDFHKILNKLVKMLN